MAPEQNGTRPTPAGGPPDQWQGIDQWLDSDGFRTMMRDEFPEDAAEWLDPVTRRQFVTLMGASLALAGAAGCNPSLRPASQRKQISYVKKPDDVVVGVPLFFATAMSVGGVGTGLIVKSQDGRPIKVEGNPDHPGSLGGTGVFAQASILSLYDPDRSKETTQKGIAVGWDRAKTALRNMVQAQKAKQGAGLRILTDTVSSPTLAAQFAELKAALPRMKWVQYDAVNKDNARKGADLAFRKFVSVRYQLGAAKVAVALDSDFLSCEGEGIRYSHDFMAGRRVRSRKESLDAGDGVPADRMNRLYAVESMLTGTGMVADHRLPLRPSEIESFARALARKLGVAGPEPGPLPAAAVLHIDAIAADLQRNRGAAVVIPGDHGSPQLHALCHAINGRLDAFGKTVLFSDPVEANVTSETADQTTALRSLVDEMRAGQVDALLILGGNPVYDAPADLEFAAAVRKVAFQLHLGLYPDETAELCEWHVNAAHFLEAWGDCRGYDGTAAVQQPLIAPLHEGRTALEVVALLTGKEAAGGTQELVRAYWQKWFADGKREGEFEPAWQRAVKTGVVEGTTLPAVTVAAPSLEWAAAAPRVETKAGDLEIQFRPDPTVYDGRFANNGWLQELPKPMTTLCWDNAAIVSPATADRLRVNNAFGWTGGERGRTEADLVELEVGGRKLTAAVLVLPGHADDAVTLHLGYGRRRGGEVLRGGDNAGTGFNTYLLRTTANPWTAAGVKATRTGGKYLLAVTQGQHAMEGRRPARHGTVADVADEQPDIAAHKKYAYSFADNPPAAAGEKGIMRMLLPGTPEERAHVDDLRVKNFPGYQPAPTEVHEHHAHDKRMVPLTLYSKDVPTNAVLRHRRWAMTIDLGACTACSACVVACVAENNIPVVGKREVTRGRAMHWIRVDRYFAVPGEDGGTRRMEDGDRWAALKGENARTTAHAQPVPCMQCEKAPCEVVCPVNATVHSDDGLNDMAYNRCVGTRYCSNNCPYKVRRFNFVQYADYASETMKLMNNPEVTVRQRGVMEKCTYCTQRIRNAEIEAEREFETRPRVKTPDGKGRPVIFDKEILTACQQACPTGAIVFGDIALNDFPYLPDHKDPAAGGDRPAASHVGRTKLEPTHYGLLAELNTMPRTGYLAAVKNPNPELVRALAPKGV